MLPNFVCGLAFAKFICLFFCGNWEGLKNDAWLLLAKPIHYSRPLFLLLAVVPFHPTLMPGPILGHREDEMKH